MRTGFVEEPSTSLARTAVVGAAVAPEPQWRRREVSSGEKRILERQLCLRQLRHASAILGRGERYGIYTFGGMCAQGRPIGSARGGKPVRQKRDKHALYSPPSLAMSGSRAQLGLRSVSFHRFGGWTVTRRRVIQGDCLSHLGSCMPTDPASDRAFRRFIEAYGRAWAPKQGEPRPKPEQQVRSSAKAREATTRAVDDFPAKRTS